MRFSSSLSGRNGPRHTSVRITPWSLSSVLNAGIPGILDSLRSVSTIFIGHSRACKITLLELTSITVAQACYPFSHRYGRENTDHMSLNAERSVATHSVILMVPFPRPSKFPLPPITRRTDRIPSSYAHLSTLQSAPPPPAYRWKDTLPNTLQAPVKHWPNMTDLGASPG